MTARSLLLCALAFVATPALADDAPVSFKKDVQPILNARCVACHVAGAESGGLNLQRSAAIANLVGVPSTESPLKRVEAGASESSYLIHKLRGTQAKVGGSGAQMPLADGHSSPLSPEEIALIERWIAQGAKGE